MDSTYTKKKRNKNEGNMKGIILLADYFEDVEAICTIDMLRRAGIEIDLVSVTGSKNLVTQSNISLNQFQYLLF